MNRLQPRIPRASAVGVCQQSVEDMIKAMKGDTSIKPTSETIISGGKKDAEAEA